MLTGVVLGIVYTAKKIDPKPAAGAGWFFQKIFGEGDFIAAGVLRIPPQGRKPSKGTKDNTYVRIRRYSARFNSFTPSYTGFLCY
jgi:centromere protein C